MVQAWNVSNCKSISSSAQYVTLQKYVFTYILVMYSLRILVCNPTHKTEIGTANRWGTTNSKPPGRIIMTGQIRNTEQRLDHIYYTLLYRSIALLRFLSAMVKRFSPAMATHAILQSQNHFCEPNQHCILWIFFIQLYCARSITPWDALSTPMLTRLDRYLPTLSGYQKWKLIIRCSQGDSQR
jgi:putative component of membrane protein insertase Oxa1/YidC/SpoIIIJ protein YidD